LTAPSRLHRPHRAVCIDRCEASQCPSGDRSANAADTAGSIALGSPCGHRARLSAASVKRGRLAKGSRGLGAVDEFRVRRATQSTIGHAQLRPPGVSRARPPWVRARHQCVRYMPLAGPRHRSHAPRRAWPRRTEPSERTGLPRSASPVQCCRPHRQHWPSGRAEGQPGSRARGARNPLARGARAARGGRVLKAPGYRPLVRRSFSRRYRPRWEQMTASP
jgi:hypothetical protein